MEDSEALRNSIGRWVKGRILGRGAQGTVFLSQLSDGRHAACKQINTEGLGEEELRGIMREITLIRALHHENVVGYLGLERDATRHRLSIFMEYAMGGSVRQLLQDGGAFSEARAARTLEQVLRGLTYLHAHGVAHRDIKGANILLSAPAARERDVWSCLSPGGAPSLEEHCASPASVVHVAKLADFGASKRIGTLGEDKSVLSGLKGTPRWMAPEVIKGQIAGTLDGWVLADVWSMGCTMVEMVTGEMPWPMFPNPMAAMYHIADGKAPPLGTYAPTPNAKAFLDGCCRATPAHRSSPAALLAHAFICGAPERPEAAPPADLALAEPPPEKKGRARRSSGFEEPASPTSKAIDLARSKMDSFPILQKLRSAATSLYARGPSSPVKASARGVFGASSSSGATGPGTTKGGGAKEKKKVRYEKAVLKQANDARAADPAGAPSPDPPPPRETVGDRRNIASAPNLNWGHGHVRHSI
ncbi:MAP kinase kinase kinase [Aureococcus anophagefferens]|nr:MAP kinase kinase kinase [Aureococcus anophagefferens]